MKLMRINNAYPEYLAQFYKRRPQLLDREKSFKQQLEALHYDGFGLADFWSHALKSYGYEMLEITANAEPVQRAWAHENGIENYSDVSLERIVLNQVSCFKPDILWYDHYDENLLRQIRQDCPKIRLILGWVGSAIPRTKVWKDIDLVLSCAPESLKRLQREGIKCEHLNHGFDPRINTRLRDNSKSMELSFIGQIVRESQYHLEREKILERLCKAVDFQIFSPSADIKLTPSSVLRVAFKQGIYFGLELFRHLGIKPDVIGKLPGLDKAVGWTSKPLLPINLKLKPFLNSAVFGLEMFQVIKDSNMTLNIHADTSPEYASNMRLWEVTGAGACLVTDWKKNIGELFEPDKEVITYTTVDECIEKVKWLAAHPKEREAIAMAGQARTLRDHTFTNRAEIFTQIINTNLK